MQRCIVAAATLLCLAQALPQNYEYNPEEAKKYVDGNPYINDPENYGKNWSYEYKYDAAKNPNAFAFDAQAEDQYKYTYDPAKNEYAFAYDPAKQETFENAGSLEDLTGALEAITSSSLFSQALGECKILQTLPGVINEATAELSARRGELENAFRGLDRSRSSAQAAPGAAVRQLSTAVGAIEPIIPIITRLFTSDDSCKLAVEASRKKRQAVDGCAEPTELSMDIFLGVADLLDLTADLNKDSLSRGADALSSNEIQEQANLIRDGAVSLPIVYCHYRKLIILVLKIKNEATSIFIISISQILKLFIFFKMPL